MALRSNAELAQIWADNVLRASCILHIFGGHSWCHLQQSHLSSVLVPFENSHVSDGHVDDVLTRERQIALVQKLVISLGRVLHRNDNLARAANQVHGAAHSLDHLAWDNPVRQIALARDLEASQD